MRVMCSICTVNYSINEEVGAVGEREEEIRKKR
jgi:hypothetical protein